MAPLHLVTRGQRDALLHGKTVMNRFDAGIGPPISCWMRAARSQEASRAPDCDGGNL